MGENAAAQIYSMILSIIPTDLITPFQGREFTADHFPGICSGLYCWCWRKRFPHCGRCWISSNTAVQFMMGVVSRYIAVFVFVSLLSLALSDSVRNLGGVAKGLLLAIAACVVWPLLYVLWASLRLKVSFPMVLRKLLPTYLIALSRRPQRRLCPPTWRRASESWASPDVSSTLPSSGAGDLQTRRRRGIPVAGSGPAEFYGVSMSASWVVTGVLTAGLLAIAAPPVPGGSLTCYTVLLTQLGIPAEAVGLAVAGNVILDFFMTSCGLSCLQAELMLSADNWECWIGND